LGASALLEKISAACPEMTALADLVRGFAALLTPAAGNDVKLTEWITAARAVDLPPLRSLTNGLEIDRAAVDAALTMPQPQRPHRRRQHPHQKNHETDARTRQLQPPPPPHPPALTDAQRHHRLRARAARLTDP
jgi:hypothetical protein